MSVGAVEIKFLKHTGLAKTICIRCVYGIFGREITKYTVIYGVYILFWPTRTQASFPFHPAAIRKELPKIRQAR
jgi:hypothetical protein